MGRDKALVELDGRPMALIAADALRVAGADRVVVDRWRSGAVSRPSAWRCTPTTTPGRGRSARIVTALGLDTTTGPDRDRHGAGL